METRNVNNDVLSNETYETKEELIEAVDNAMEDKEVKTIKVTKDIPAMTYQRRNYVEKKLRKTLLKAAEYEQELRKG